MRIALLAVAAAALAFTTAARPIKAKPSVTIYRCTDARGAVTVQNDRPCPKGHKQSKRVMETVKTPTAPAPPGATKATPVLAAPSSVAVPPKATSAVIAPAVRAAPPSLFECKSFDGTLSLVEAGAPVERCAPLTTTGVNGNPALGAGQACEMRTDTCTQIAATELCTRWRQRLGDAQAVERFGNEAARAAALADIERTQRVLAESTCAAE